MSEHDPLNFKEDLENPLKEGVVKIVEKWNPPYVEANGEIVKQVRGFYSIGWKMLWKENRYGDFIRVSGHPNPPARLRREALTVLVDQINKSVAQIKKS